MADQIAIFRKGALPKGKTEKQVNDTIEAMIDAGTVRKVRRQVFTAILGGSIAKLPAVTQHEIDKTNGPRKLLAEGKGWIVPEAEFGASGATDSTVIAIKRQIQNALGVDAELFSVCRIHGRTAMELGE